MRFLRVGLLLGAACAASAPSLAATMSIGASNDTWIRDSRSHGVNGTDAVLDSRLSFVPYIQFDMSSLNIDSVSSATLRLWKVASARNDTITNDRFATYGLSDDANNTLQIWHETLDFDPLDATNGLDFRNVGLEHTLNTGDGVDRSKAVSLDPQDGTTITETVNNATGEITLSGAALVSFLNDRVDANGLVTIMLVVEGVTGGQGWGIASKENSNSLLRPQLDLEYTTNVPEPTSLVLVGLAGAALFVRRRFV